MGAGLWIPCAVPSVGVLCFRAWWEASSESPWIFDDASRLHDLKRPSLFRRDKVPARNTHRGDGFAFTHLKKFLRVPRGAFSKTHPWQGVGQRPTESEKACTTGHAFSGGTKSLHETPTDRPALPLRSEKSFWGAKGRFFKNAPLAGCGTASHKERASQPIGARLFRGETQEKADLTGMIKFAILYTRDEWITHNKKRMQFFLREGKKSEQAV